MKRYCQTLELVNDPELIEKYCELHAHVWPEVIEGQRAVGILDMQIYRFENHVFMICETWMTLIGKKTWPNWPLCLDKPSGKPMWPNAKVPTPTSLQQENGTLWKKFFKRI